MRSEKPATYAGEMRISAFFLFFFFSAHVKRFHEVAGDAAKLAELKRLKTL